MVTLTVSTCCLCLSLRLGSCLSGLLSLSYCFLTSDPHETLSWTVSLRIANFLLFLNLLLAVYRRNSRLLLVFIVSSLVFMFINGLYLVTHSLTHQRLLLLLLVLLIQMVGLVVVNSYRVQLDRDRE